jgi:7-keto-8-aminopelargonate synthetase-like enzyme
VKRFAHNDLNHLERILRKTADVRRRLVAVDAVYSMEGTIAPIPELVDLVHRHNAFLLVDEAHAIGILGDHGRGIASHFNLSPDAIDIRIGTMSKALAAGGGFAAVRSETSVVLRYGSAGRVFSAAMTPADTAAALAAVRIMESESHHVTRLRSNASHFHSALVRHRVNVLGSGSAIVPIAVNDQARTLETASSLLDQGYFVNPVVAPGVPIGKERLRCLVSATHRQTDLTSAADAIADLLSDQVPPYEATRTEACW